MTKTSKTQAKREIKRRKGVYCAAAHKAAQNSTTSVERAARAIAISDGTFHLSTSELRSVMGTEVVKVAKPKATQAKATTTVEKSTPAKRKGDPEKAAAWASAVSICEASGIDATGPKGGPTPEFWTVYKAVRADQRTQAAKAA